MTDDQALRAAYQDGRQAERARLLAEADLQLRHARTEAVRCRAHGLPAAASTLYEAAAQYLVEWLAKR